MVSRKEILKYVFLFLAVIVSGSNALAFETATSLTDREIHRVTYGIKRVAR